MLIAVIYGRHDLSKTLRGIRTYTYLAGDEDDIVPGDIVLVPPTWLSAAAQEATVVRINVEPPQDDDIDIVSIIRVVEHFA